jgi:hypothetical protein
MRRLKSFITRGGGIETKYKTVKQKLELENSSGRLVENIKQDFYAMMTVSNMIASCRRVADRKVKKDLEGLGNKYKYQVKVTCKDINRKARAIITINQTAELAGFLNLLTMGF